MIFDYYRWCGPDLSQRGIDAFFVWLLQKNYSFWPPLAKGSQVFIKKSAKC
jgi:hypothetical protein